MIKTDITEGELYTGTAREILSLYRNLREREVVDFIHASYPRMNMNRNYGLVITRYDQYEDREVDPVMSVVSASTALELILGPIY